MMRCTRFPGAMLVWGLLCCADSRAATFYVAPNGNDAWSGRLAAPNATKTDGPLATLAGARERIRGLKKRGALKEPVAVLLREGTYRLSETFVLRPQDSGTPACPITYAAHKGERPVLSGGRRITGWQKQTPGLWTAKVSGPPFRQLWVNGTRRTLARSPNTNFFRIVGKAPPLVDPKTGKETDTGKIAFRFRAGDIKAWGRPSDVNAVVFYHWETAMLRLKRVDPVTNTALFTGPMKWPFWGRQRYYIENAFDALDTPGEWFFDRHKGLLYYRPMPGEDMAAAEVVAPVLTQLVRFEGDADKGQFVEHVRFEGLSFEHADYRLEPEGHGDWQAAVTIPAVIQADGARHCAIDRCEVAHVGMYGIWFRAGCAHNRIVQNEVHDVGCGGVRIGTQGIMHDKALHSSHNVVHNNFIHDIGHLFCGAIGVWVGQSSDNAITHNEICDTYYTGISCGWSWGFRPTACHRNKIEYNHIHHIGRGMLCDMGAIYTLGISTGTTVRHNLIHHVWDWEEGYGAGGIYPDEGSSGILIENNVVYLTATGGLTVHYGRDNVVRNNIFALGRDGQIGTGRKDKQSSLTFVNNIVYFEQTEDGRPFCRGTDNITAERNVYFDTAGKPLLFLGETTFAQWQAKGYDKESVIADPLFVSAKRFDFRLRSASPALELGFKPIDVSRAGLVGPKLWVDRPGRIVRSAFVMPKRPEPTPLFIDDGFEISPLGGTADFAHTHGESNGATIRVTNELAAAGSKCLKFVDVAGLKQTWNPHLYYQPHIRSGLVRLTFDLRLGPGAVAWHEWRDRGSPYRVAPSLSIDASGNLVANTDGKTLMTLPREQWIHFEIRCGMGKQATGRWQLVVTIPGQEARRFDNLTCDPKCRQLEWLGFISNATDHAAFFLDNVKLETVEQ